MTGLDAVLVFLFVCAGACAVVALGDWLWARHDRRHAAAAPTQPEQSCWLDDLDVDWRWSA